MAEEDLLLPSPDKSTSLLSEISNVSTRAFVLAFTVTSCGALSFGCIIGYSAPTQSGIMKDLNLSIADYSLFGSILTVGLILGALVCGKLADLVGRVNTIWITNTIFVIGWFAIAFAKGVWMLDIGRLLQRISIGISSYLGPVYITELAPRNLRGAASSLSQLFVSVGISVFYALGTAVAWRNLAIFGSMPCLMTLPLLFFIPESPRWLMLGGILGTVLVDISGRRSLLLVSQAGMFLGCLATAISFFLQKNNCWESGTPMLVLISVLVYFGSYGLGMGPLPWIIASEIYPVDVKGAAGTVCNLASSIGSWLVTYFFSFLLQWSSTGTFMMFATVIGFGFVFTAKLVPETKGKSLEEIQSLFTDSPPQDSTIF